MPKINVYLPDELAAAVKEAQIPVSAVCQAALEKAVHNVAATSAATDEELEDLNPGGRFRHFTPRARAAVVDAREVAIQRGDRAVGTEHVLLGILDEGANLGVKVLETLDVELDDLRAELEGSMRAPADGTRARGHVRFSRASKDALRAAMKEALGFGHNYIGCEHLLLGVLATEDGLGSKVLRRMGLELRTTRRAVVTALSGYARAADSAAPATALDEILKRLDAIEQKLAAED